MGGHQGGGTDLPAGDGQRRSRVEALQDADRRAHGQGPHRVERAGVVERRHHQVAAQPHEPVGVGGVEEVGPGVPAGEHVGRAGSVALGPAGGARREQQVGRDRVVVGWVRPCPVQPLVPLAGAPDDHATPPAGGRLRPGRRLPCRLRRCAGRPPPGPRRPPRRGRTRAPFRCELAVTTDTPDRSPPRWGSHHGLAGVLGETANRRPAGQAARARWAIRSARSHTSPALHVRRSSTTRDPLVSGSGDPVGPAV